jgi:ferrous iron transport protein A
VASRRRAPERRTGLAGSPVGAVVRLTGLHLAARDRLRLAELGLRPGAAVTVLARTAGDGRVVGLGTSRIALDHATACRLAVESA